MPTKNLSVNNVYVQLDLPECNDRCRQVVERQKAAIELFVPHQQFAKPVEPTVRHFNNPASGLLVGGALEFIGFLPSAFDMRNVAMLLDDFQRGRSGIARVSAQMFVSPDRWAGSFDHDGLKHRLQLGDIMSVGSGHDERQRDATPVHQQMALAPIFFPDPSGSALRPLMPRGLSPLHHRCFATTMRCLPFRRIPPIPFAKDGKIPPFVSTPKCIYGWNWHAQIPSSANPSIGSPSAVQK